MLIRSIFLLAALLSGHAQALTADEARAIATGAEPFLVVGALAGG